MYVSNLESHTYANAITELDQPQGVYFISQLDEPVVGNEGNGVVEILNGSSFNIIKSINTGIRADNIQYNQSSKIVYVSYGNDTVSGLAVINASTSTEVANITLCGGNPEAFQLDSNDSRLILDDPSMDSIDIIDIQNNALLTRWQLCNLSEFYLGRWLWINHITGCLWVFKSYPHSLSLTHTQESQLRASQSPLT